MSKFELTINKDYAPDWTITDSIRELFQNALDQETVNKDNPMFWNYENETFKVGNLKSILSTKSLLLGNSTKSDNDDTIGQFGEGYKIATLVLVRSGKKVTFYNYGAKEVWTAEFKYSKKYESEILTFNVDKKFPWTSIPDNDLTIEVEGISLDEMIEISNSNLHIQKEYNKIETKYGEVLLNENHKGKIFVNGLFISEVNNFKYGYNLKPNMIKLDRDRKLIREFDLKWTTSELWASVTNPEYIELASELILEDVPDVKFLNHTISNENQSLYDSVFKKFRKEHGYKAVPVSNQKEAELVPKECKSVLVSQSTAALIRNNLKYKPVKLIESESFLNKIENWIFKYGDNIKREYKRELLKLIKEEKLK